MTTSNQLNCPTCGAAAQFAWHGNSPFMRYGKLVCPKGCHVVRVTYNATSFNSARLRLIKQWEELSK